MKKSEEAEKNIVIVSQSKVSKANNGENQPSVTVKGDEYIYDSKAEPEIPETPKTPNTPKEETPKKNPTVNYVTPEPTPEPTPSKNVNPIIQSVKTGDNIIIFVVVGIVAVAGVVVIIILKKKNKKEE